MSGQCIWYAGGYLGGRPAGVLLGRPQIPSSLVPNELVDQCLAVLQGKSRSLIIRELQRDRKSVV